MFAARTVARQKLIDTGDLGKATSQVTIGTNHCQGLEMHLGYYSRFFQRSRPSLLVRCRNRQEARRRSGYHYPGYDVSAPNLTWWTAIPHAHIKYLNAN